MFERLHNPGNAELVVMERGAGGRYSLLDKSENQDEASLREFGLNDGRGLSLAYNRPLTLSVLNSAVLSLITTEATTT
jgi:hypothetical protein